MNPQEKDLCQRDSSRNRYDVDSALQSKRSRVATDRDNQDQFQKDGFEIQKFDDDEYYEEKNSKNVTHIPGIVS